MGERRIRRYARTWFNMQVEIVACAAVHDWKGVGTGSGTNRSGVRLSHFPI